MHVAVDYKSRTSGLPHILRHRRRRRRLRFHPEVKSGVFGDRFQQIRLDEKPVRRKDDTSGLRLLKKDKTMLFHAKTVEKKQYKSLCRIMVFLSKKRLINIIFK